MAGLPKPRLGKLPYTFSFMDKDGLMSASVGPTRWLVGIKISGGTNGAGDGGSAGRGGSGSAGDDAGAEKAGFLLTADEIALCKAIGAAGWRMLPADNDGGGGGGGDDGSGESGCVVRFMLIHIRVPQVHWRARHRLQLQQ